jgi:hypothetical protein
MKGLVQHVMAAAIQRLSPQALFDESGCHHEARTNREKEYENHSGLYLLLRGE